MKVTVRLFAILRERAGRNSVDLVLADGATVADAIAALQSEPRLGEVLERLPVQMAVNRDYASLETVLEAEDELALVPPVSGGADVQARITDEPISVEALSDAARRPGAGAIVIFEGTTRDVSRLDYEAYVEMAEARMMAILDDCLERYGLQAAIAEHRIGPVPLGEPSVIVAVSARHRDGAFAGARAVIDRIKAEAPIWKREVEETESGERRRWIEGTAV